MKKLFLQGPRMVGKSSLLQSAIQKAECSVGGFYVKRHFNHQGIILGFELRAAKELLTKQVQPMNRDNFFIQTVNNTRCQKLAVFETFGLLLLKEAEVRKVDLILLDEIGGIELLVPQFTKALTALIEQPRKIIGVYKSEQNFQTQKLPAKAKQLLIQKRSALTTAIAAQGGVVLSLTAGNRAVLERRVLTLLQA